MRQFVTALSALLWIAAAPEAHAQQVPDPDFSVNVAAPAFAEGAGPVVAIDAAHDNYHRLDGRYAIFGQVLRRDGYRLMENAVPFSTDALRDVAILVIANAGTEEPAPWHLPTPSAFTDEEIEVVVAWVHQGGSLFLIADHMPAAGAASALAKAFGLEFTNGYTYATREEGLPGDLFTRASGLLGDHAITRGRSPDERIDSVMTFTGQAFQATVPVQPLLTFGPDAYTWLPVDAEVERDERTPRVSSPGWPHGVVLRHGNGRVAVFGEAAMFSAQLAGENRVPIGMNHPRADQNVQFLLNVMHWLSGLLPD